jgi:carboxylesterase
MRVPLFQMHKQFIVSCITLPVLLLPSPAFTSNNTVSFAERLDKVFPDRQFEGRSPAILLLHGFGGSPIDMQPLARELKRLGIAYNAITLPGHGTSYAELEHVTMKEWLYASFSAYNEMKKKYGQVNVVGFSLGGALALCLAEQRDVPKTVLISPYFEVKEEWYYFGKPEEWATRMSGIKRFIKKRKIGQINDPARLKRYDAYEYLPLKAIGELPKLGNFTKEKAKRVTSKLLWIHSSGDIVADYEESKKVFESVPSKNKRFIRYEKSNHIILYDYDSEDAIQKILEFLVGKAAK